MKDTVIIETKRLLMRPFRLKDLNDILEYRGDPEVARFQLWEPYSADNTRFFIRKYQYAQFGAPGRWTGLGIQLKSTSKLIGDVALKISQDIYPQAEIGYNVNQQFQRKGFGSEGVKAVLDWVFTNTSIHRVTAVCDSDNKASAALLEKLGFRREGHFHKNVWSKGRWTDEYLYALLKTEWGTSK